MSKHEVWLFAAERALSHQDGLHHLTLDDEQQFWDTFGYRMRHAEDFCFAMCLMAAMQE